MSVIVYSTGTITFTSERSSSSDRTYSDRSLIELLEENYGSYSLRARDIPNQKKIIFELPLTESNLYKIGVQENDPDVIRDTNGRYRICLKSESRTQFHDALRECYQKLNKTKVTTSNTKEKRSTEKKSTTGVSDTRVAINEKTLISDIHKLGVYIQKGKDDKVDELVRKLILGGVRLRSSNVKDVEDESKLRIQVKIDGLYADIQNGENLVEMEVYPSTKVCELRAIFEYKRKIRSANQYFFVNGHLAHAESTMNDLKVQDGSLFILLVIKST